MYKQRHLEQRILMLAKYFKIVLVTGARQVGKSTILRTLLPDVQAVTFEGYGDRLNARQDPEGFLRNHPKPLILDEVQYVPELLSTLKRVVDESDQMGQYFLTGSHNLSMLKVACESMAGRVGIIDLEQMTLFEQAGAVSFDMQGRPRTSWLAAYLEGPDTLVQRFGGVCDRRAPMELILRGGYPGLLNMPNALIGDFFGSYIRTYLERDVRYADSNADLPEFDRFLGIMAGLTSQEVNISHFSRELGIARAQVQRWEYVLRQTYQWREVHPYVNNPVKRVVKRGKGYMSDTGIACFLQSIRDVGTLLKHPLRGALFETYCVNTVFRLIEELMYRPQVFHWRTIAGAEVDMVLHMNGLLYPIEVKAGSRVDKYDARGIMALRDTYGDMVQHGIILYSGVDCYRVREEVTALPFNALIKQ